MQRRWITSLGNWIVRPASCSMRRGARLKYRGQRQRLAAMQGTANQRMWLLVLAGEVQGFAVLIGGGLTRNRHCALVVMGLRSSARGQGWGERLLRTLIASAPDCGISRLELG